MTTTAHSLRIVFAGTPAFSAQHLKYLIDYGHNIVGVYTQPDRPGKRGKALIASPVKQVAADHQLPIYQPVNFKSEQSQQQLAELNADVMVVVAYGLLLPQVILDTPKFGCINVHASILPRWRGAAPIERAIAAGDKQTGITIMQMDAGLDTGAMLAKLYCGITAVDNGDSLREKLAGRGFTALVQTLADIANDEVQAEVQDNSLSTYASKLNKNEAAIDWAQSSTDIALKVRAFNSANVAYSDLPTDKNVERVKIWQALPSAVNHSATPGTIIKADKDSIQVACGEGVLDIALLQLPGGKVLDTAAMLNGRASWFTAGTIFGPNS
jgi:methionyl-tRNA formyltransferase